MSDDGNSDAKPKKQGLWRPIVLIVVIVAVLILARMFGLGQRLEQLQDWIETLGI